MAARQFQRAVAGAGISLGVGLALWASHLRAAPSAPPVTIATPAVAAVTPSQPTWAQLTPAQKQILAPLASDWDKLDNVRRKKWLGIVERYGRMSPQEQERVQDRMRAWVRLTPQERRDARSKFNTLQQLPPEKKEVVLQKWQEYENLPQEEKQRLNQAAKAKHPTVKNNPALPRRPTNPPPLVARPLPTISGAAPVAPPVTTPAPSAASPESPTSAPIAQ